VSSGGLSGDLNAWEARLRGEAADAIETYQPTFQPRWPIYGPHSEGKAWYPCGEQELLGLIARVRRAEEDADRLAAALAEHDNCTMAVTPDDPVLVAHDEAVKSR